MSRRRQQSALVSVSCIVLQITAAVSEAQAAAESAVYQQLAEQEAAHEAALAAAREAGHRDAQHAAEAARREEVQAREAEIQRITAQHQQEVDILTQIVDFSKIRHTFFFLLIKIYVYISFNVTILKNSFIVLLTFMVIHL